LGEVTGIKLSNFSGRRCWVLRIGEDLLKDGEPGDGGGRRGKCMTVSAEEKGEEKGEERERGGER